jgi:hypothetical protein
MCLHRVFPHIGVVCLKGLMADVATIQEPPETSDTSNSIANSSTVVKQFLAGHSWRFQHCSTIADTYNMLQ